MPKPSSQVTQRTGSEPSATKAVSIARASSGLVRKGVSAGTPVRMAGPRDPVLVQVQPPVHQGRGPASEVGREDRRQYSRIGRAMQSTQFFLRGSVPVAGPTRSPTARPCGLRLKLGLGLNRVLHLRTSAVVASSAF